MTVAQTEFGNSDQRSLIAFGVLILGCMAGVAASEVARLGMAERLPITMGLAREALYLMDWAGMCLIMMAPATWPMLKAVARLQGRVGAAGLVSATLFGFIAVWVLVGVALRIAANGIGAWPALTASLLGYEGQVAGGLVSAAGLYLLSPFASRCAAQCRSPQSIIATNWRGAGSQRLQALKIGLAYGASCVGCCWPQMTLMALASLTGPIWMALLAVSMAGQKSQGWGKQWQASAAGLMILCGLALTMGWVPLPTGALFPSLNMICGKVL